MVVAICIEASHQRGAGHLFRAMVLARELVRLGHRALILVNDCAPALERLSSTGLEYRVAPVGVGHDWVRPLASGLTVDIWVDDRLDTDAAHGAAVRSLGIRRATFDDRGQGARFADLNVCALAGAGTTSFEGRRVLTGEEWLVIDPGLARYRRLRTACERLLVTMGGSDTYGVTLKVADFLLGAKRRATVVTGPLFAHGVELESLATGSTLEWRSNVADMGALFERHDLAVTGGGLTAFEAASTGLPVVVIANEPHEVVTGRRLEELGCARFAGYRTEIDETAVLAPLDDISRMSAAGMCRIPADGVRRVCREILHG